MMKVTKKQFLSDVMHEIDALKANATAEEKARLNFNTFDPNEIEECIYGQMTGDCTSKRAKELMDLSCIRVFNDGWKGITKSKSSVPLSELLPELNGGYDAQDWTKEFDENDSDGRKLSYISALEGYIFVDKANNENVIAYIKGETDTLTL